MQQDEKEMISRMESGTFSLPVESHQSIGDKKDQNLQGTRSKHSSTLYIELCDNLYVYILCRWILGSSYFTEIVVQDWNEIGDEK